MHNADRRKALLLPQAGAYHHRYSNGGVGMALSRCSHLVAGVAMVTAGAVVAMPSPAPLPSAALPSVQLTVATGPLWPRPAPDSRPIRVGPVERGVVPSLAAPIPTLPVLAPAPAATNINQAIKNIYITAEPWVRYGFELAAYAVGWVPWVGWLSPQVMIFYNFGERIVRSITFNVDDWLFGPLPFGEGLANVARDSWDALAQLGVDQWNFWLPPLPPLPLLDPAAPQISTLRGTPAATPELPGQTSLVETPDPIAETPVPPDLPTETSTTATRVVDQEEEEEEQVLPVAAVDEVLVDVHGIAPTTTSESAAARDLDEAVPGKRPVNNKSPRSPGGHSSDEGGTPVGKDSITPTTTKSKAGSKSTGSAGARADSAPADAGQRPRGRSIQD